MCIRLTQSWPGNAIAVRTRGSYRLEGRYDVSCRGGLRRLGQGRRIASLRRRRAGESWKHSRIRFRRPTHTDAALQIGNKDFGLPFKGSLDDLRIYNREITPADIAALGPLRGVLNTLPNKRPKEQQAWIREYYLSNAAPAGFAIELGRAQEAA